MWADSDSEACLMWTPNCSIRHRSQGLLEITSERIKRLISKLRVWWGAVPIDEKAKSRPMEIASAVLCPGWLYGESLAYLLPGVGSVRA
jgi:hypothetical protein